MPAWKYVSATFGGLRRPGDVSAVIFSRHAEGAATALKERLAGHSIPTTAMNVDELSLATEEEDNLVKLVSADWPVSVLSAALDLPARSHLSPLPDSESLNVARYGEGELESALEQMLEDDTQSCFAIIDGASFPGLPELLSASTLKHECLFRGHTRDISEAVAPWVVELQLDEMVSRRLIRAATGKPGGYPSPPAMIISTEGAIADVLRHFRRLTRVQKEDGGRWVYFRYADPLTMDDMRASMNSSDADAVLGHYSPLIFHRNGAFRLSRKDHRADIARNAPPFKLSERHEKAMRHRQGAKFARSIKADLQALLPNMRVSMIEDLVSRGIDVCRDTGLQQQDSIAGYILLSGFLGSRFTQVYSRYASILDYRCTEASRKTAIHAALAEVSTERLYNAG